MPWSWRDRAQEAVRLRSPTGGELGVSGPIGGELSVPATSWNRLRGRRPRDSAVPRKVRPLWESRAAASSKGAPRPLITRWAETSARSVDDGASCGRPRHRRTSPLGCANDTPPSYGTFAGWTVATGAGLGLKREVMAFPTWAITGAYRPLIKSRATTAAKARRARSPDEIRDRRRR